MVYYSKNVNFDNVVSLIEEILKDFDVYRFGPVHRENVKEKIKNLESMVLALKDNSNV